MRATSVIPTLLLICCGCATVGERSSSPTIEDARAGLSLKCPSGLKPEAGAAVGAALITLAVNTGLDFVGNVLESASKDDVRTIEVQTSGHWIGQIPPYRMGCLWLASGLFGGQADRFPELEHLPGYQQLKQFFSEELHAARAPNVYLELAIDWDAADNTFRYAPVMLVYQEPLIDSFWEKRRDIGFAISAFDLGRTPGKDQPFASALIRFSDMPVPSVLGPKALSQRWSEWMPGSPRDKKDPKTLVKAGAALPVSLKLTITETKRGSAFLGEVAKGFQSVRPELQAELIQRLNPVERAKLAAQADLNKKNETVGLAEAKYKVDSLQAELDANRRSMTANAIKDKELEIIKAKIDANFTFRRAGLPEPFVDLPEPFNR